MPAFAALVFTEAGVTISINALGTELFPTHLRATAKSWITNAGILGATAGLAIVGALSERAGGAAAVIALLAIVPMFAAPLLFAVRETRGEELETLA
jgi:MFS family permease